MPYRRRAVSSRKGNNLPLVLGLAAMIVFFLGSGLVSYRNSKFLVDDAEMVAHTHEVITSLELVISLMKDAETGQRGFVITGNERYLQPYLSARANIDETVSRVESLTSDNPDHIAQLEPVKAHIRAKFDELEETINIRRTQGFEASRDFVASDRGRTEMDLLRTKVSEMEKAEYALREKRIAAMKEAYRVAIISGILTAVLGVVLAVAAAYLVQRSLVTRRRQDWLNAGRLGLGTAIAGDKRLEQLGQSVLGYLANYLDAHAGAFYTRQGDEFRRTATYGVPSENETPERFKMGEGLLGQAALENSTILINDVPDGYLKVGSSLGQAKPRQLVISAVSSDGTVNSVLEIGFVHPLDELGLELLKQSAESIGTAVRSANYRSNLQEFLEETQRQAEELQAQSEELRVSNEELEEQSRALKESQSRLEQQQAELEQTNSQLEEQTQQLENQRNDLARANLSVEAKAEELRRASRYKSDFLANMSHELRTPLNSSLILSKLLSDNPDGNLTPEQVKYAQTIQSSGNDLLALINDILDLSKIEAGHMEVRPETLPLSRISGDLTRMFEPLGRQKNLPFILTVQPGCPEFIETDRQRLEQILKNLLSNAFKFTESGRVELVIGRESEGLLSFAVTDTGIGISKEHQRDIFEAFRQADGTISRKYGGTGLGLSISRELARLLGGAIRLHSKPGQGSTFTLVLPETFGSRTPVDPVQQQEPAKPAPETPVHVASYIRDDREQLAADSRTILVVEDDETFARILYDLAHEMDFRCLIASTAEDALAIARQYLPNAVILDVGLPDNSGLLVLDRLKQDTRTRHIPIHVVSAGDYSQTAYSLGAMGYMLKPVKREDLVGALRQIETRLGNDKRRVLIVEDDAVQRESLMRLLGSGSVETVAVGTASECLDTLKESTYDCMVLDLTLPDASGYSLLETLSQQDAYSFPPVIVYTGRDLSSDEEQRLRRYSKSIIIKGAKSPERLLDEVTLFLHRVVSELPAEHQRMLQKAHNRDAILEGRRILVVEDDVRNVYALTNIFEPRGAIVQIARNGLEALEALEKTKSGAEPIDLVLMDVMMPEMDGMTATREIRKQQEWRKLPVIMLTAKAMKNDQERCLDAGANDYMAKPIDVEKLLSLVRVWMPR